jgi:hypothetical protein
MKSLNFGSLLEALRYFDGNSNYLEFDHQGDTICEVKTKTKYQIKDIKILQTLKFEDSSDADETTLLYVISTPDGKKGTLVDASGIYADLDLIISGK